MFQAYLSSFYSSGGVNAPSSTRRVAVPSFEDSLRRMQEFFGLEVTGSLDSNTLEVMAQPRCGVTDVARFAHFDGKPRWEQSVVTYRYKHLKTKGISMSANCLETGPACSCK